MSILDKTLEWDVYVTLGIVFSSYVGFFLFGSIIIIFVLFQIILTVPLTYKHHLPSLYSF